jgi:hypothetical protein
MAVGVIGTGQPFPSDRCRQVGLCRQLPLTRRLPRPGSVHRGTSPQRTTEKKHAREAPVGIVPQRTAAGGELMLQRTLRQTRQESGACQMRPHLALVAAAVAALVGVGDRSRLSPSPSPETARSTAHPRQECVPPVERTRLEHPAPAPWLRCHTTDLAWPCPGVHPEPVSPP